MELRRPLLILTAVLAEAGALSRATGVARPEVGKPCIDRGGDWEWHLIGMKARHLPPNLKRARAILLTGLGGGLDPKLAIGDLVLQGLDRVPPTCLARLGRIVCSRRLVETPEQKAALFEQTGAAAVDMESDAIRAAAGDVPIVHLRAISDTSADSLHADLLKWVTDTGKPRPGTMALGLLQNPARIGELIRLRGKVNRALEALARAVPIVAREL